MDASVALPPLPPGFSVAPSTALPPLPEGFSVSGRANPADSYANNVGNDWMTAQNKIGQLWANQQTGEGPQINPASTGLQMLGTAAGGAYAPVGEAAKSAYNSLPDQITQPINSAAGSVSQGAKNLYNSGNEALNNTGTGQAIGDYLMNSPHIQNGMQEVSDDAKALANVLTLAKVKPAVGDASMAIGDKLLDSGNAAKSALNDAFIQKLVLPKETPTQLAENAKNTIQVNGKNIYQPTPDEIRMARAVTKVPGVGNNLTAQGNLSAIIAERTKEAESLKTALKQNGAKVDISASLQPNIDQAVEKATNNPLTVVKEGSEAHQGAIDSMNKAIFNNMLPDGTLTAAGLLQARKDFDQMLPPRTFTGTSDTVLGNTAKQLRAAMNKTISDADPSAGVKESLKKQSALYDAADNVASKAAGEAATPMGRAMQRMSPHNLVSAVGGAGIGAGALAAAHYLPISPSMIGAAIAPVALYKGVTAPSTRVMLGKALGGGQ